MERALSGVGLIVGSGGGYRYLNRAVNSPTKYLGEFERGLEKAGAKISSKLNQIEGREARGFEFMEQTIRSDRGL